MTQTQARYIITFDSRHVADEELVPCKNALCQLFKLTDDQVNVLFKNKPVALKRNLSESAAKKTKIILTRAGVPVGLIKMPAQAQASSNTQTSLALQPLEEDKPKAANFSPEPIYFFQPAPADELRFDLKPPVGKLITEDEIPSLAPAVLSGENEFWTLMEAGSDMGEKSTWSEMEVKEVDTSEIELKDNDSLVFDSLPVITSKVSIEHLRLLDLK